MLADRIPTTLPPAGSVFLWSVAAICLLAVLEQVKFRVGRLGRDGSLPGEAPNLCLGFASSVEEWCSSRGLAVRQRQDRREGKGCPPPLIPSPATHPQKGPPATIPFLGGIVQMVRDPHAFWERQRAYALPGLSWNAIVTKFTVMVTDPAVIRHVFNHNRCGRWFERRYGIEGDCWSHPARSPSHRSSRHSIRTAGPCTPAHPRTARTPSSWTSTPTPR